MRIAVLADIHGNAGALEAVLRDIEVNGPVDRVLVLGDLVAFGPDAVAVVHRLLAVPGLSCIWGNTDRWVVTGEAPLPPEGRRTDQGLRGSIGVARACGWAAGQLAAAGTLPWLAGLPRELRLELPSGARLLCVHGSPGSDEEGIGEQTTPERLAEHARAASAEIVLAGHTHRAFHAKVQGTAFHTLASVSNPKGSDLSAAYAVMEATNVGERLTRRSVAYDHGDVITRARAQAHPALDQLERTFGPA